MSVQYGDCSEISWLRATSRLSLREFAKCLAKRHLLNLCTDTFPKHDRAATWSKVWMAAALYLFDICKSVKYAYCYPDARVKAQALSYICYFVEHVNGMKTLTLTLNWRSLESTILFDILSHLQSIVNFPGKTLHCFQKAQANLFFFNDILAHDTWSFLLWILTQPYEIG